MSVITITGPTCAGKSHLERRLAAEGLGRVISHTTRSPRLGELDGRDYHFVNARQFTALQQAGGFIEVVLFGGQSYGVSINALNAAQQSAPSGHAAIVCDPHGAEQVMAHCKRVGIPCLNLWIDSTPEARAERWLRRVRDDLANAHASQHDVLWRRAGARLGTMLGIEQGWAERCKDFDFRDSFYDRSPDAAVAFVKQVLDL